MAGKPHQCWRFGRTFDLHADCLRDGYLMQRAARMASFHIVSTRSAMAVWAMSTIAACAQWRTPIDSIDMPLTQVAGDVMRGRDVFVSREAGNCVLCHTAPGVTASGNVGPPVAGIGGRLNAAQLRLRVVDITRVNADAAMPAFHRVEGLNQVASRYRDQPVLSGQQVEDVVAYLGTLK